ncbi:MAG TPA: 16S rRNA (cytidine(1402)-2'-O)-methyltransferase [Anaerolineales bacterium]|jgi:16S rRNA (cytidine1402-2'-O)-methyltransferase|nr:16S rRNA (cytidine(1402)-2'-O)-methyltransferase [Anaerolineales bacterium]
MGILYLVATPIGNLEDISVRALRVLREVQLIAAEDTRQTRKLLQHYEIQTAVTSYHEHSKLSKLGYVLEVLQDGEVALVSDAGTPTLNDPGYELVRAALETGHTVSPIPGPSAPIAALVASGLPTDSFLYLGYLPRKKAERRGLLEEIRDLPFTLIFLEAPHRLLASLEDLDAVLGNRQVAVARELTKLYEEIFRGNLQEAQAHFAAQPPRGEFTLVIGGRPAGEMRWTEAHLRSELSARLDRGDPPSQIASQVASESRWPRRKVYQLILKLRHSK